jgi:hypothetical protein
MMICWALQHSNDEELKFGRICVQEMMGGLLYFTQLHLLRCTTHTHQTAQPLFVQGTILLLRQLAAPVETTAALNKPLKNP